MSSSRTCCSWSVTSSACLYNFTHNFVRSLLEVVPAPMILAKDPFMRLKRKKLGPTMDLKDGR